MSFVKDLIKERAEEMGYKGKELEWYRNYVLEGMKGASGTKVEIKDKFENVSRTCEEKNPYSRARMIELMEKIKEDIKELKKEVKKIK